MHRETTFWVGGALTVALGVSLGVGLLWAGVGVEFAGVWIAVALTVGLGGFFLYVARDEREARRAFLREAEHGPSASERPRIR